MILLDGLDKQGDPQGSKAVAESSSTVPVARAHTPTPSLPDYEASQAQLKPTIHSFPEIQKKRTRRRRCRKCALYALVVYFVLTIAIGVPIIVVKLKRRAYAKANPYDSWTNSDPIPPKTVTLGDAPLRLSSARSCNSWSLADSPDGSLLRSELSYRVPVNGSLFLNTNITYSGNGTYLNHFSGQLLVGVNDDASASDATVHVTMHHTTSQLRQATNVCLMGTGQGGGLYLFTPMNLTLTDALIFNITLLLPQNSSSTRNIPELLCHLPHFQQTYLQLDPYVTFDSVILGGARSGVSIEVRFVCDRAHVLVLICEQSIQASTAVVKASSAEIRGKFTVDSSLSLETVSAPINADIHLVKHSNSQTPTFLHLTTGNDALNASVTMYVPPDIHMHGPHFVTHAETFNAPLSVALLHDDDSIPAMVNLRAINNIGNTRVTVDSRYQGTFDVSTMFAQADVLTNNVSPASSYVVSSAVGNDTGSDDDSDDDDDDDENHMEDTKIRMFLPSATTNFTTSNSSSSAAPAAVSNVSRCLEYDLISSSEIRGWVGIPPRPPPSSPAELGAYGVMGHLDIVSSLSGAQLELLT
ncbi:hypothetical protein BD413DRAFT_282621 [Trametes elegans]|nr:hypothetical protein BD413DRAFT_282621 [Trametes elegans]